MGFVGFEAGLIPREALILVPNLFEFWFVAVAFTMRYRSRLRLDAPARGRRCLAALLAGKLAQEWALHVARLFDGTTFLGALGRAWDVVTAPFRGR